MLWQHYSLIMKVDMDKICRVCLKAGTKAFLIFDDNYSLDNHNLADILSACTIYKINRDDELPHHMCGDCVDLAKKAFIFKRDCERAYRQLMNISNSSSIQYTNVESSHRIKIESEVLSQDKSTQTDNTTICPNECCEQNLVAFYALRKHRGGGVICGFCSKSFNQFCYLESHIAAFHPESGYKSHNQYNICKRQFTKRENVSRHSGVIHKLERISDTNSQNRNTIESVAIDTDDEQVHVSESGDLGKDFLGEIEHFDNSSTVTSISHSNRIGPTENIVEQNASQPDVKPMLNDEDEKLLSEWTSVPCKNFVEVLTNQVTSDELINSTLIDPTNPVKVEVATIAPSLLNGENSVIEETSSLDTDNDMLSEDKDYKCPACGKAFHRRSILQKHISSHIKEKKLSCEICMKCFSRSDFLKRHLHSKHNDVTVSYKCDECDMRFMESTQYKHHNETKHNNSTKMHTCEICQKSFTTKLYMRRHVQSHTKRRYMCKECAERFSTKDELNQHRKTEGHDKLLLCPICGFRCKTNNILTIHMRRHKGEKPYKCKFCSKGFPRVDDLRIHEKYHTGEKSHFCETCGKGFQRKYNLTIHKRVHTGEKPYQCPHCPQAFSQSNDLKSHIRRHTGERFRCEFCGAPFLQSYQMRQHKLTEHGVKENPPTQRLEKYTSPEEQEQQIKQNLKRELAKGMDLMDAKSKDVTQFEVQSNDEVIPIMNIQDAIFWNI